MYTWWRHTYFRWNPCFFLNKGLINYQHLTESLGPIHTRHNIAIKRYFDKKIILRHSTGFYLPTKVSSKKAYLDLFCLFIYLDLFICQDYPWFKSIFLSQYLLFLNIVRQNVSCEQGLNPIKSLVNQLFFHS
jgi:hypothetical protein